ncbi:MAG: hypothetical protein KatS3mg060_2825 [Dehalococcoidia bacterium]|nr:MAG: hypothetical protein KatS3mg060_2825 [Dehalococcoidia bacterium]
MTASNRHAAEELLGAARETGPDAVSTLVPLLDDPAHRLAAIEALGATRSQAAADRLQQFADDPDKLVRKAARAALHRLKSAGIVPTPTAPTAERPEPTLLGGAMSSFDSNWSQIVRLYVRGMLGARRELSVGVDARFGIRAVDWRDIAKPIEKHLQDLLAEQAEGGGDGRWHQIPADYAAHRLREAMKRNTASGHGIPPAFLEAERYLPEPDPYTEPLIYRYVRALEVKLDPTLLEHSGAILDEPELAALGLPDDAGKRYRAEALRISRSPVLVVGVSRESQLIALAQRAHREVFTPPVRLALRLILEETALMFWLSDRQLAAKRALAAAVALAESESAETPFSARLVAREIFGAAGFDTRRAAPKRESPLWTP